MRKIQILGLALFAVFAFGAISAASALAVSEWLVEGKVITALEGALSADTEGTLTLSNELGGILGTPKIECKNGVFEGTVGPGAEDHITDLVNPLKLVVGTLVDTNKEFFDCTLLNTTLGCGTTGQLAELWPDGLNLELSEVWLTKIELSGTTFLDDFPTNSGYEVKCPTGAENLCGGLVSAILENLPLETPADVTGKFTKANTTVTCTVGTGWLEGEGLTVVLAGGVAKATAVS